MIYSRRDNQLKKTDNKKNDSKLEIEGYRESIPIYGTSIGYSGGRSSLFVFFSYYGPVLGATPLQQSILVSVRNLGSNIFQSIWGWLSDLKGRKLVLTIGLSALVLCTLLAPFINNPLELVILALFMTGIGFSFIPAWNALLGDYSSEEKRASFIGKINSIGTYLSIFVILVMGLFMDSFDLPFPSKENMDDLGLPFPGKDVFLVPFLGASLLFGIALLFSFLLVEKYDITKVRRDDEINQLSWKTLIDKNPPFKRLLPIDAFFRFAMSTAWPIFPFVTLNVVHNWTEVSVMWILFNLPRGFGQSFGGKLADRYGKKNVLWLSRLGYTLVPISYSLGLFFQQPLFLICGNIPGGFAFGAEETSIATYSLDCSTEETKARYFSILLTAEGITAFIGSLFSGFVMEALLIIYGSDAFFLILSVMLALITVLRFASAMLHGFIYPNPLEYAKDLDLTSNP